jgi:DNA polymerase-1
MLYLIDSSIYIFRGWQTVPVDVHNRFDQPDNAVQGFAETLCHILENHQPALMVCAFDECFRQGVRNQLYTAYKADRPPAPADLTPQFARCKELAKTLGIPIFGSDRTEADDIIGQFADIAHENQLPVTIVSGDKDLAQFITPTDFYWDIGRNPIANYAAVHKRFKIRPDQIADWLALSGDKSDNIPGVPGVGPTTAAKLLNKWGDLPTLLANLGEVSMMKFRGAPRISRLLYEHKESIHLARSLTGLIRDERLPNSLDAFKRRLPEQQELSESLYLMGFTEPHATRIAKRVGKQ